MKNTSRKNRSKGKSAALLLLIISSVLFMLLSGCSSVFSAYIGGTVYDDEEVDAEGKHVPIEDVTVYLYADKESRDADYSSWYNGGEEDGPLPHEGAAEPDYFLETQTNEDGQYEFSGFTWQEMNPEFGKTADRQYVYFLFYHKNYGLQKNSDPDGIMVISEVSNPVPPQLLSKYMNTAVVKGAVLDEFGNPLENAEVSAYIPEDWSYTGEGTEIDESSLDWGSDPSPVTDYTDVDGEFEITISYHQKPSREDNRENTLIRLTYTLDGYLAEHEQNSNIVMNGFDPDDDGDDNPYYQTEISDNQRKTVNDISMVREENEASLTLEARYPESSRNVENVSIRVYVAEDWEYDASGIKSDTAEWPESPSYQGTTDGNGEYTVDLSYPRKPGVYDNKGNTLIRIVAERDRFDWLGKTDYDKAVTQKTDAAWDPSQFPDDNDAFYEMEVMRDNDHRQVLHLKETEFINQELWGYLYDDADDSSANDNDSFDAGEGLNNYRIGLFVDVPHTAFLPELNNPDIYQPVSTYTTRSHKEYENDETAKKGYFIFSQITWTDTDYSGSQSEIPAFLALDDDEDTDWDKAFEIFLYSNMDNGNYDEIEIDSADLTSP